MRRLAITSSVGAVSVVSAASAGRVSRFSLPPPQSPVPLVARRCWSSTSPADASSPSRGSGFGFARGRGGAPPPPPPPSSAPYRGPRGPLKDRVPSPLVDPQNPRRRLAVLIDASNPFFLDPHVDPARLTLIGAESEPGSAGSSPPEDLPPLASAEVETGGGVPNTASSTTTFPSSGATSPLAPPPLLSTVLDALHQVGFPVLFRLFSHDPLPDVWAPYTKPWNHPVFFRTPPPSLTISRDAAGNGRGVASLTLPFQHFRVEPFIPLAVQMEADAEHLCRYRQHNAVEGVCFLIRSEEQGAWAERMAAVATRWETESQRSQKELSLRGGSPNPSAPPNTEGLASSSNSSSSTPESPSSASSSTTSTLKASSLFFNQYVLDEMGLISSLCVDGRSENGI